MIVEIKHECANYDSFRANKVKSLFNPERGHVWGHIADLPIEANDWQIGLIVGPSGSGKTSIGSKIFGSGIHDLYAGWPADAPIVDAIAPAGDLNAVTSALSAVGLGDVPAWLRPFHVLSNGEKFRAGLARLIVERPDKVVIDEFTSVIDRQIAKVGAASLKWAYRRKEPITAATWFWADTGLDTGPICEQEIIKIDYSKRPRELYADDVLPAMERTLVRCLNAIQMGFKREIPQVEKYASFDKRE